MPRTREQFEEAAKRLGVEVRSGVAKTHPMTLAQRMAIATAVQARRKALAEQKKKQEVIKTHGPTRRR
jgi:hypothetical protein